MRFESRPVVSTKMPSVDEKFASVSSRRASRLVCVDWSASIGLRQLVCAVDRIAVDLAAGFEDQPHDRKNHSDSERLGTTAFDGSDPRRWRIFSVTPDFTAVLA